MPHVFVILFFLVAAAAVLTWLIPAGEFDYEAVDVNGTVRNLVVPGSFHYVDSGKHATLIDFLGSFHKGLISGADVMMLIFIVNGAFSMVIKTGAFNSMMGGLLRKFDGKEKFLVPIFFLFFAICASLFGMWNDFNGLIPIMVGMGIALGYDAMFGFSIILLGIGVGFAAALMNPYTIVVAQSIAGIPIYSGMGVRVAIFVVFSAVAVWWIFRYGKKIKEDPSKSLMAGEESLFSFDKEELKKLPMGKKEIATFLVILASLVWIFYGFLRQGWGNTQLTGVFLLMGIVVALIYRWSADKIAREFINGCKDIVFGAMIVGVAKAVLIIMQDGKIIDTIIYFLSSQLEGLPPVVSALGMLVIQTFINFVIPSGSGQAATIIPLMAPLGDLMGLTREVTVLTFQFGDGFSNLLWPTANIAIGCGIAGVPLNKWWKFFLPLFGIFFAIQVVFVVGAVLIGF
ncbi:MAG: YfcC family protein [Lawsonibacter sp.]|nr:YfcC family protein [Lawsonibacter sp.]